VVLPSKLANSTTLFQRELVARFRPLVGKSWRPPTFRRCDYFSFFLAVFYNSPCIFRPIVGETLWALTIVLYFQGGHDVGHVAEGVMCQNSSPCEAWPGFDFHRFHTAARPHRPLSALIASHSSRFRVANRWSNRHRKARPIDDLIGIGNGD
jgi:hypothetical protein